MDYSLKPLEFLVSKVALDIRRKSSYNTMLLSGFYFDAVKGWKGIKRRLFMRWVGIYQQIPYSRLLRIANGDVLTFQFMWKIFNRELNFNLINLIIKLRRLLDFKKYLNQLVFVIIYLKKIWRNETFQLSEKVLKKKRKEHQKFITIRS